MKQVKIDIDVQHADSSIDALASCGDPALAFLRQSWFSAGPAPANLTTVVLSAEGSISAALPLRLRRNFGVQVAELAGGYWPLRSPPISSEAEASDLAKLFDENAAAGIFRLGPCLETDRATDLLVDAACHAGWTVLEARIGTIFELPLPDPATEPEWPSAKTRRKNRWRKRRLAESGELRLHSFSGGDWTAADRNAMAAIEQASWLSKLDDGGDTKFASPSRRAFWEDCARDPVLAKMLRGSILWIGNLPAAFVFGIMAGETFYCIANNFNARYRKFGPGRVLLYDEFERARQDGVRVVNWGSGDGGYKSEMGARPGPALRDLLVVKNPLLAFVLRPFWQRRGERA